MTSTRLTTILKAKDYSLKWNLWKMTFGCWKRLSFLRHWPVIQVIVYRQHASMKVLREWTPFCAGYPVLYKNCHCLSPPKTKKDLVTCLGESKDFCLPLTGNIAIPYAEASRDYVWPTRTQWCADRGRCVGDWKHRRNPWLIMGYVS